MYDLFNTKEEAEQVSRQEAVDQGCTGKTVFWWAVHVHPSNGTALVERDGGALSYEDVRSQGFLPEDDEQ